MEGNEIPPAQESRAGCVRKRDQVSVLYSLSSWLSARRGSAAGGRAGGDLTATGSHRLWSPLWVSLSLWDRLEACWWGGGALTPPLSCSVSSLRLHRLSLARIYLFLELSFHFLPSDLSFYDTFWCKLLTWLQTLRWWEELHLYSPLTGTVTMWLI